MVKKKVLKVVSQRLKDFRIFSENLKLCLIPSLPPNIKDIPQ